MAKKLIALISSEGKTPEQLSKEANEAYQKYQQVSQTQNVNQDNMESEQVGQAMADSLEQLNQETKRLGRPLTSKEEKDLINKLGD